MPTLELLLDASSFQRGAQQAETALKGVQTQTSATERAVTSTSKQIGSTFLAASTSIGSSVTAFSSLNAVSGTFAASRALFDIGNLSNDFRNLSVSATGFRGVLQGITLAVRANPLGALATALSLVAVGMSLFGSNTKTATEEVKKQATALDGLQSKLREVEAGVKFGGEDPRTSVSGLRGTLTAIETSGRKEFTVADAARLFGVNEQELRYALAKGSALGEDALSLRTGANDTRSRYLASKGLPDFALSSTNRENVIGAGQSLLRDRQNQQYDAENRVGLANSQRELDQLNADIQRRREEEASQAMEELIQKGREFGATVGDAFVNWAQGLTSARQAVAGIISDIARAGSRSAFGNVFGAAFGATGAQKVGNNAGGVGGT